MAHPYDHARSSARKFGGVPEDYVAIHSWFDGSKAMYANWRHRALRHHAEGIFMAETLFGVTIENSDKKKVPVRLVGEQHVREDLGWIPSMQDWFKNLAHQDWMTRGVAKLALDDDAAAAAAGEPATANLEITQPRTVTKQITLTKELI